MKFFPLGDRLTAAERKLLGVKTGDRFAESNVRAIFADVSREPKKGEWYLSGAIIEAYRAPNDLSTKFQIAELVMTETVVTTRIKR